MKRATFLVFLLSSASFADDPFACVDPDVADAFLGNWYQGRPEYSTSIPDGFVRLDVPAGLSLVGSQVSGPMTTVVYKTLMDAEPALDAAVGALAESGWVEFEDSQKTARRGFQSSRGGPAVKIVCNDDGTNALSVIANDKSGHTLISYMNHSGSPSCGGPTATTLRHDPSEMMTNLPILKLPEGAKASNTGMGGNGDEVNSRVDISGPLGRSELANFFEDQIRLQSWEFQTSWSSHLSSGSVWRMDTEEDGILIGTLHVYDSGAGPIRVRFSVNPADPTKGTNRGSWGSTSN